MSAFLCDFVFFPSEGNLTTDQSHVLDPTNCLGRRFVKQEDGRPWAVLACSVIEIGRQTDGEMVGEMDARMDK
jgi:hypothetical protein